MLTLNGQRMSKSTGNTLLPNELFSGNNDKLSKAFSPMVVRFFILQAHYRSALDFSSDALEAAEKGFERLTKAMNAIDALPVSEVTNGFDVAEFEAKLYAAMNDDFNSPILISELFDGVKYINSVLAGNKTISQADKEKLSTLFNGFVNDVLGLDAEEVVTGGQEEDLVDDLMKVIIDARQRARQNKDFETSDRIRDLLGELNITIKDSKEGASWEKN